MTRGRKPGYTHSEVTKQKISKTMTGSIRPESAREATSAGRADSDLSRRCMERFLDMRSEYPGEEEFFDKNKVKLLKAMRDVKSEKELRDIRKYFERPFDEVPRNNLAYQYDSSSIYAHEDVIIELIDTSRFLKKFETDDFARLPLSH